MSSAAVLFTRFMPTFWAYSRVVPGWGLGDDSVDWIQKGETQLSFFFTSFIRTSRCPWKVSTDSFRLITSQQNMKYVSSDTWCVKKWNNNDIMRWDEIMVLPGQLFYTIKTQLKALKGFGTKFRLLGAFLSFACIVVGTFSSDHWENKGGKICQHYQPGKFFYLKS